MGKSIGQGIKEFKKGLKETEDDVKREEPRRAASLPHEQTLPTPEKTSEHSQVR